MTIIFRPLGLWPRKESRRRQGPFKATYRDTLNILDREFRHLAAKEIVVQADVDEDQIRLDGLLRSDARPRRPNIAIGANTKFGPLQYYCDEFLDWQDNLRGIALTLERLRLAELYGVTKRGEQYTGFRALPMGSAPTKESTSFETADAAADWLTSRVCDDLKFDKPSGGSNELLRSKAVFQAFYREAAKRFHPDAGTGSNELFLKLQEARRLIEDAHKMGGVTC